MEKAWFASWFDSPYYPILYQHRDYAEAEKFIEHLLGHLGPVSKSRFLDLACGRGRHAWFIRQKGHRVRGLDLSPDSIKDASKNADKFLSFAVHDMRDPIAGTFDFILNLFTSIGYFDDQSDNLKVLQAVKDALAPEGTLVIDFMNIGKVIPGLVAKEQKSLDGIDFGIQRSVQDGFIIKDIEVTDKNKNFHFQEKVQALGETEFEGLFEQAGLTVASKWGDYHGMPFDFVNSPRLIYFCQAVKAEE